MAVFPSEPPIMQTNAATLVTALTATLNGEVLSAGWWFDGGIDYPSTMVERGFVYSTSPNPTTADTKVVVAGGVGAYSADITGLAINTIYHVRAYGISDNYDTPGPSYGADITFVYLGPLNDFNKSYIYKVLTKDGLYLGDLPNVTSEFGFSYEINTVGSQITITCGVSADTSILPANNLTDELYNNLTDEDNIQLTDEGQIPIISIGNSGLNTLIKNGNRVEVWEYGYYHPNGQCVFKGDMERWETGFGGDSGDAINVIVYSDGQDLDNYLVRGYPYTYTADQSQVTQNGYDLNFTEFYGAWHRNGQSWKANATNLGAIDLYLNGSATVTVSIYSGGFYSTLLGTITKVVNVATPTVIKFALPNPITTVVGTEYFAAISVNSSQSIKVYYKNTNVYADGTMFTSDYGGGSGGGEFGSVPGSDLYFKTYSGTGATTCTFTTLDPSTGMLELMMDDYIARGGLIAYTSDTIDATGLSLTYEFNTNTTLEGIAAVQSLAPDNFYHYVDLATDLLYFLAANTVADLVLTKDRHLTNITIAATIEGVKNSVYFTGGDTGAGVNLYKQYSDAASLALYRTRLDRLTDNRVIVAATADAISNSDIAAKKDEQYQTTVTVVDKTMDISTLRPGMIVGFNGFGTFVDALLMQIVRIDYTPEAATLTLGILPKRMLPEFDKITRGLIASQTISNPTAPS